MYRQQSSNEHRPGVTGSVATDEDQYLTFQLQEEMYAFGILGVREILEYRRPTRMPMMPGFIEGVISLRGEVVPVVNLARRFGVPDSEISKKTCIVVIEVQQGDRQQDLGILVDSVSEVIEIPSESIRPAPEVDGRLGGELVRGMGKVNDSFVILLAENRLLSRDQLEEISAAAEQAMDDELND
jgi:purine-binding chemotaxis protein CheW